MPNSAPLWSPDEVPDPEDDPVIWLGPLTVLKGNCDSSSISALPIGSSPAAWSCAKLRADTAPCGGIVCGFGPRISAAST